MAPTARVMTFGRVLALAAAGLSASSCALATRGELQGVAQDGGGGDSSAAGGHAGAGGLGGGAGAGVGGEAGAGGVSQGGAGAGGVGPGGNAGAAGAGGGAQGGSAGTGGCAGTPVTCYRDADNDGFGDPAVPDLIGCMECAPGYVVDATDCNDHPDYGALYHPGQTQCQAIDSGGGWDYDCDGSTEPSTQGCAPCGAPSANPRWCSGNCSLKVYKLLTDYSACGVAGMNTKTAQTCGDAEDCHGTYPLTNNVGEGDCVQTCR